MDGNIAGFEFLVAPDVTNGIYTPGYVPRDDGTEGVTPAHGWETSQKEHQYWLGDRDIQVVFLEELVEIVLLEIIDVRGIEEKHLCLGVE